MLITICLACSGVTVLAILSRSPMDNLPWDWFWFGIGICILEFSKGFIDLLLEFIELVHCHIALLSRLYQFELILLNRGHTRSVRRFPIENGTVHVHKNLLRIGCHSVGFGRHTAIDKLYGSRTNRLHLSEHMNLLFP
nr:MAG TPA: hypothetical protein [Caudoviricetes sp.]